MSSARHITEGYFLESEEHIRLVLSPLWSAVYVSGVRGHHILFDSEVIEAAETAGPITSDQVDALEPTIFYLLSEAVTLTEARRAVDRLPLEMKVSLYFYYRNCILPSFKREIVAWSGN